MQGNRLKNILLFSLLSVSIALPAQAQIQPPEPGTYAISFALFSSGVGSVGVRKMLNPRTNAGLALLISVNRSEIDGPDGEDQEGHEWSLGLHPDLRLYRQSRGNVLPFLDLNAGISYGGNDEGYREGVVSAGAGVGVEWFPVPSMSLSGKTGVALAHTRTKYGDGTLKRKSYSVSTRTSSLSVNLYF